ncbi:MAG: hypothetical protein ACFCGT_00375 [Sandaracinaceae bacterium]
MRTTPLPPERSEAPDDQDGVVDLWTLVADARRAGADAADPGGLPRRASFAPIVPYPEPDVAARRRRPTWIGVATAALFAVGGLSTAFAATQLASRVDPAATAADQPPGYPAPPAAPRPTAEEPAPEPPPPASLEADEPGLDASPSPAAGASPSPRPSKRSPREVTPPAIAATDRRSDPADAPGEELPEALPSSLAELIDQAVQGGRPPPPEAGPGLPELPSREDVRRVLDGLELEIGRCAAGRTGRAEARIAVHGPTGRVTAASLGADFAGAPQAACMERVLRGARFPAFARERFTVVYPYRI